LAAERLAGPPPYARFTSPERNADGSLTFRIWAPKASEVKLQCGALLGGQSDQLERFNGEYWRITVKPAASGQFRYKFLVDGVQTTDPVNPLTIGKSSVVRIAGPETAFFTARKVPHGTLHRHFYHNPAIETVRSVMVYTPPQYDEHPEQNWPVLFLFHGSGGTDESWFRVGQAHVILDNLIAAGRARPMLMVAPFGHTVEPGTHGWPFVREQGDFIQDFGEVLLPFLEARYRISPRPADRALAGFSMGASHTLQLGLNRSDVGHLGVFSWGSGRDWMAEKAPQVLQRPHELDRRLETLMIACGREDFLFQGARKLSDTLTALEIDHSFIPSDGGHEMANWRRYLHDYAQHLFKTP
jgi:enterochelin esterase family protein